MTERGAVGVCDGVSGGCPSDVLEALYFVLRMMCCFRGLFKRQTQDGRSVVG